MKAGERGHCWFGEVVREVREPKRELIAGYRHRRDRAKEGETRVDLTSFECPSAIELRCNTDYRSLVFG